MALEDERRQPYTISAVQWVNNGYPLTMGDSICLSKTPSVVEGDRGEYGRFNRDEERLRDLGIPVGLTNTPESPRELASEQLPPGSRNTFCGGARSHSTTCAGPPL